MFLSEILEINSLSNILEIVVSVIVALILGVIVFFVHKFTTDEFKYDKEFGLVMIFVPATVALFISVTGTSVARAFGIAAVLAIVRFRTSVMKPIDVAYVFFSVAVGFAAGVKLYVVALIFVFICAIASVIFNVLSAEKTKNIKKTHKVAVPESIDYAGLLDDVLAKYTNSSKLVGVKIISGGTVTELTYAIKVKDTKDTKAFLDELRTLNANFKIALQEFTVDVD